jgi:hypothetical protein
VALDGTHKRRACLLCFLLQNMEHATVDLRLYMDGYIIPHILIDYQYVWMDIDNVYAGGAGFPP